MSAFVILFSCFVALTQAQTQFHSYLGTSVGRASRCQSQPATFPDSAWSPAADMCSAMNTTFVGRTGEKSAIVSTTQITWDLIPASALPLGISLEVQLRCTRCAVAFLLYGPFLQNMNGANHAINANFAVFNSRLSANTTFPWNSNSTLSPTKLVERFTTVSFFVGPEPVTPSDAAINNIVLIASWSIDIRIALVEPSTLTRNQPTNVSLWVIDRNLGANCDQLSLTNQIGAFDLSLDGVAAQVELTEAVPQTQWSLLLRTMVTPAQSSVACRINATITPTSNLQLIAFGLDFKSGFQLASSPVTLIGAAPPTTPSTTSTTTTTTTSTTEMSTEPTTSSEIVTESETTTPTDTTTTESSSDAIDVESPSNGAAIGGIIGGVVGGILLLVCLGVAIFCILRRSNGGEQIQTSSLEAAPEARNSDTFVAAPTSAVAIPPPLTDRPVVVDAPMPVFVNNAAPPPPLPTVGTVTPARIVATPPPPPPPPQPKGSKSPRGGGPTNVQYTGLPNNQQGDAFQHGL